MTFSVETDIDLICDNCGSTLDATYRRDTLYVVPSCACRDTLQKELEDMINKAEIQQDLLDECRELVPELFI